MALVLESLLALGALYASLLIVTAIHEAGHVVGSLLMGLTLIRVRVGPIEFFRSKGWKRRWVWKSWFDGVTRMRAASLDQGRLTARFAVVVICGPLANVMVAGITLFLSSRQSRVVALALVWLGVVNLLCGVGNMVPASGKMEDSDGRKIVHLLFQPQHREGAKARLTYLLRLAEFKRSFGAGDMEAAAEQLRFMEKIGSERNTSVLLAINGHLREHLDSGERLDDCKWEPPSVGTAFGELTR